MCGICGQLASGIADAESLRSMSRELEHRGPDDEGFFVDGRIALACRRLSIVDIEGGHMPIANEDETAWIIHNGEIYNYAALRDELTRRGHRFRTGSDSEVILHLYEEMGPDCVNRLDGMFAFAIWDAPRKQLVIARDRLGQKPLYYTERGGVFYFASEIKALLAGADVPRRIDMRSLQDYLSLRFVPPPRTMLEGIRKLPAAHVLTRTEGRTAVRRYWSLDFRRKRRLSETDWVEALREKLQAAVRSHLIGDVPVGALLSGGLDSSMIVAVMAKDLDLKPHTFAIGVAEPEFDELPYANVVAERYGTTHEERRISSDLLRELPAMIRHLDEPSDPIAACQFHAARLAAESVKVVLGGDGGDELFGGFDRYWGLSRLDWYGRIPTAVRNGILAPFLMRLANNFRYKGPAQKLAWLEHVSAESSPARRYAEATSFFRFSRADKRRLFEDGLAGGPAAYDSAEVIASAYRDAPADTALDRMLYADIVTRLPEHSLMLTDRMSMANSLELRAPMLDHHLMEFMAMAPDGLKIKGTTTKHLLRRLAGDYLPERIVRRKKQGFMFPVASWFAGPLYPTLSGVLGRTRFVEDGLFRASYIQQLLDEHRERRVDHHVRLWMLLNLELWRRMYIDGDSPESCSDLLAERL